VRLRDIVHVRLGPSGRAIQLRGVTVDLTEHQRAEEALRQTEEQLRQAQKMDAVGKLAGGIAHDFNNLLMVIRGDSELILRRLSPEDPLRAHAERTREAADQAATLTRKLLAFSRKQVLAPTVLDVNRIVGDLHTMLDRLLGETIQLVTVTAPNLGSVTADPGQVEQMLLNLAVNARDAMPDGGRLTIQTANRMVGEDEAARTGLKPGQYVMLEVTDTGVGMDADVKAHLFEPFFTTKDHGTGLGLSTVYGIVNQSGGHIRVDSEWGKGTTFRVFLPRVEVALRTGAAAETTVTATGAPSHRSRGETIFLVEDAERVRAVVREILEMQGYEVIEARHGAEALALEAGHNGPIHLLITDVVMPEMSGRELAQRLVPLRPKMNVLYISGYTDDAIVRHGVLEAGMALLPKPFTPDALAAKVREILDTPRRSPAGATPR
jgi:signal transduction histidine kinase/ActR/RegA family two-component response regulator